MAAGAKAMGFEVVRLCSSVGRRMHSFYSATGMIRILLALSSALLLTLSFPSFNFGFLTWIALIPLLLAIRNISLKSALALSWIGGTAFFMGVFWWINLVKGFTPLHYFILVVYLGSYIALFGVLLNFTSRRSKFPLIVTAPVLWVATEYLRGHAGFMELPFGMLSQTQYLNLPLLQMASFTGAYGISLLIMLVNAGIADLIIYWMEKRQKIKSFHLLGYNPFYAVTAVLSVISCLWVWGWSLIPNKVSGKPFSVAVVQGNIPQDMKWKGEYRQQIISRYEDLSKIALRSNPQLIVWPEASTPGLVLKDITLLQRMISIARDVKTYLLVGSAEYPKFDKALAKKKKTGNTAIFFSPEGKILGQYIKTRLLPFGEYVPLEGIISWPDFIIPKDKTNFHVPGTEGILFSLDGNRIGTLICWEIIFPELSRRSVREGAEFLVNISNEAHFGNSPFPYQFLSACVFRAVENRVNLVRATNTGISCFIDPYGRITGRVSNGGKDIFVEGTLTQEIFLSPPGTFYTHHGDVFAYGCIGFSIGLLGWSSFRKISRNRK